MGFVFTLFQSVAQDFGMIESQFRQIVETPPTSPAGIIGSLNGSHTVEFGVIGNGDNTLTGIALYGRICPHLV